MWDDPIVSDVQRAREQLAAQYGFDVGTIFAEMRKHQNALGARLVMLRKMEETALEYPGQHSRTSYINAVRAEIENN